MHRFLRGVLLVFGALLIVPCLAFADPLTLIDPFPNQGNSKVTEFSGDINNPNAGSGVSWIFDTQLPFSGSTGFGRSVGGALAWGSIDTQAGFIKADLVNAIASPTQAECSRTTWPLA